MAVQVFRCRFLTRPPLLLCQRWAPSSRGLLVGSLPPAPGPFVCPPPASHGLTSASRQVSKSGGAVLPPRLPLRRGAPRSGFFALPHPLSEQFVAPHAGTCWGFDWPRAEPGDEAAEARHRDGTAPSCLPAPDRDCLSGYLVLCKLFIRVL